MFYLLYVMQIAMTVVRYVSIYFITTKKIILRHFFKKVFLKFYVLKTNVVKICF